ncbi:hypothetical protein ACFS6H_01635 [Terrimonas rubra]|uniref:Uncharacterized protein n=1 Tax=Terrimonas rubra TaxID=1035890 RepID=A0ABW5ZZD5_9BACT
MKLIVFIAAFFMLFLVLKPGITAMAATSAPSCCGGVCMPGEENEERELPGKENRQNTCNPFQACCAFVSLCENRQFDLPARPEPAAAQTFSTYQASFIFRYSSDFWQPPRVV